MMRVSSSRSSSTRFQMAWATSCSCSSFANVREPQMRTRFSAKNVLGVSNEQPEAGGEHEVADSSILTVTDPVIVQDQPRALKQGVQHVRTDLPGVVGHRDRPGLPGSLRFMLTLHLFTYS